MQDAAVLEVADLVRRVEPDPRLELDRIGPVPPRGDADRLRPALIEIADLDRLLAVEPERLDRLALRKLQGQDAHPDQVRAVDPLEALGDHRADTEQRRAL